MRINNIHLLIFILVLSLLSCESGLAPENIDKKSFLNGVIYYKGGKLKWPPSDSVKAVRVVAFKRYPDSSIINDILQGNAFFNFESFPLNVDSNNFSLEILHPPVNLVYIAVVMQTDTLLTSQKVIGLYSLENNNIPSNLFIDKGKSYNIKLNVDFENLPPMPY